MHRKKSCMQNHVNLGVLCWNFEKKLKYDTKQVFFSVCKKSFLITCIEHSRRRRVTWSRGMLCVCGKIYEKQCMFVSEWVSECVRHPSPLAAKFGLELDVVLRGGLKRREQINKTSHQMEGGPSWGRWILKQCLFFQPIGIIDRELLLLPCGGGKYIIILLNVLMKTAMIRERIRACNFLILRRAFDKWWN